jgi:heme/copper-type cytochrome/quinol oxidase subunit 3
MGRNVFHTSHEQAGANRFGLWIFLSTVAILFAAAMLGVLAIRMETANWPEHLPPLPPVLWGSMGVLVASGISMQWGIRASRRGHLSVVRVTLSSSFLLVIVFLIMQGIAWMDWSSSIEELSLFDAEHRLAGTGLLFLIGLHAVHVVGGLLPLAAVVWCAVVRGTVTSLLDSTAIYWHVLETLWCVLVVFMAVVLF